MKKFIVFAYVACCFARLNSDQVKPWTVLVYIAGDNDLEIFIDSNLEGMKATGSNDNCNILACVALREGKRRSKKLRYLLITKNDHKILFEKDGIDSGRAETLIDFCTFAINQFPAQHYGLILWNHGTGPLDPEGYSDSRFSECFFNTSCHTTVPFLPLLNMRHENPSTKAVCFDDTTGNYLSEKKLGYALDILHNTVLRGAKFDFIGFDACFMATVEIASLLKKYTRYMVASEDIEPGPGWNYEKVFSIFKKSTPTAMELGTHIVQCYKNYYSFHNDLTLSCVDLEKYTNLEDHLHELIATLLKLDHYYPEISLKALIKLSAHKKNCTHFDDPELIDLVHFLENLLYNFEKATIKEGDNYNAIQQYAQALLYKIIAGLQDCVVANAVGKYFPRATGLSIYFPHYGINKLYKKNIFCCATQWNRLLQICC